MRYCGREFSATDLSSIRDLIAEHPEATRAHLSRLVCEKLDWRRGDGRLKDMSCRVAMLRMQDDALLQLPPPRNGNNNGKPYPDLSNSTPFKKKSVEFGIITT